MFGKSSQWKNRKINFSGVKSRLNVENNTSECATTSSRSPERKNLQCFKLFNIKKLKKDASQAIETGVDY